MLEITQCKHGCLTLPFQHIQLSVRDEELNLRHPFAPDNILYDNCNFEQCSRLDHLDDTWGREEFRSAETVNIMAPAGNLGTLEPWKA